MNSILIYSAIIISVTFFIWLAEKQFRKNHQKVGMIFAFIAILMASYFSGIRDSVGVDWLQFSTMFDQAHYINSFSEYTNHFAQIEKGYLALNYFLSKVISSKYVFMGLCTSVTMTFSFLALYIQRKKLSLTFGMFLFMINFYLYGFNIIRQSMSVSIALLGISLILNKVPLKKVIILFIISISIHYSSILIVVFLFLYYLENSKIKLNGLIPKLILFTLVVLSFFFLRYLLNILIAMGFDRYEFYSSSIGNYGIDRASLLKGLILLFIMTINRKNLKEINNNSVLNNMMIIWIVFSQLSSIIPFFARVSLLFQFTTLLYVPQLINVIKFFPKYVLIELSLVNVYVIYWLYSYAYRNYADVIPYITIFNSNIILR